MKKYRKPIRWIFVILVVLFLCRVLVFQIYRVPDFRMASTLLPGDRVLVNKVKTGLRFPNTIIGFPGAGAPYADVLRIPYFRLPGMRKFQRQDIIFYNNPAGSDIPVDRKRLGVSRLVGLPGDTVLIWDKQLYINRLKVDPPKEGRQEYRVVTKGKAVETSFLKKHTLEQPRLVAEIGIYDFDLSQEARIEIEKLADVSNVRSTKQFVGDSKQDFYPPSFFFLWNRDQYGPLVVPKKGATVVLELKTVDLYRDIIETHEGHSLIVDFKGIQIDGQPADEYTFKKDYCFVLDDSRDNPGDSRKIGFIPVDHIIGTGKRVLWSGQSKYDYIRRLQPGRILHGVK